MSGMSTNKNPYIVEKMTLDDVPAVAAIEQMVFPLPWSVHAFEHELRYNSTGHFVVVRLRQHSAVGKKTVSLRRNPKREPKQGPTPRLVLGYGGFWLLLDEAHICTLAVHPGWRGRGLGELLLTSLIDHATELHVAVMTLEVRASNLGAQKLYRKYGFVRVGLHKGYYSDNHEDALIMGTEHISSAAFQGRFQALKASLWPRLAAGGFSMQVDYQVTETRRR